ncbi:MAG TPA: penicillin-binding transpeptidase domain-containing protein [Vicinamibacterales bacterium]|nr:penicillin-binding transpeptidase domain-containing protein [Vicinamibacterales bacterium]
MIIQEAAGSARWVSDAEACATRLCPASTFKIPHALVALETGVISVETVERWDGVRHPRQPLWDRDHTVLSAMKPSVVWFFQRIAPRVGADRMHGWLERLHYGNADTSGDVTMYWLNGVLRISPDEQVAFLRQFYTSTLPIAPPHQKSVRDALDQQPGTVQNSLGVHDLDGRWTPDVRLNAKTGASTIANGESVSWLVGALSVGGRDHVFASAVWGRDEAVELLDGPRLAVKTFIERGLLQSKAR